MNPMNAVRTKTRWQPARRARKSRLESCGQTKKPKKRKLPSVPPLSHHSELQPILSGSESSSTVPRPSGLSMTSMDNRHLWTEEEELALFQEAETLLMTQKYSKQSARNACLMARMNERFPGVAVKFTVGVIKNKLSLFKRRWLGCHTLKTCKGKPIPCSQDVLSILFAEIGSASESTNSGAADSVNVNYGMQQGEAVSVNVNYGMQQNNGIVGYSITDCIKLVESIEELTTEEKVDAANIMRFEGMARVMFMDFTDPAVRLCWIKKELAKLPKDH